MKCNRKSYIDRRKNRFDRRNRGLWHKVYYIPVAILFTILQKPRSGHERREQGECREDWVRVSPWVSQHFPRMFSSKELSRIWGDILYGGD